MSGLARFFLLECNKLSFIPLSYSVVIVVAVVVIILLCLAKL